MKKIDVGHYQMRGFDIYEASHPKLYGKYEIYNGDSFVKRAYDLKEAKRIINKITLCTQKNK